MADSLYEAFVQQFGEEIAVRTLQHAGKHTSHLAAPPIERDAWLTFALLEILEYKCYKYEFCYPYLTEQQIKNFLSVHQAIVPMKNIRRDYPHLFEEALAVV